MTNRCCAWGTAVRACCECWRQSCVLLHSATVVWLNTCPVAGTHIWRKLEPSASHLHHACCVLGVTGSEGQLLEEDQVGELLCRLIRGAEQGGKGKGRERGKREEGQQQENFSQHPCTFGRPADTCPTGHVQSHVTHYSAPPASCHAGMLGQRTPSPPHGPSATPPHTRSCPIFCMHAAC